MSKYFIGIMTGTSADALDGCLVSFEDKFKLINVASEDLESPLLKGTYKDIYEDCVKAGYKLASDSSKMLDLDNVINIKTCELVNKIILDANINIKDVCAVGFSGQTIHHTYTRSYQLGNPQLIANNLNIKVISEFRNYDIKAGGMGAPLIPAFHKYLFAEKGKDKLVFNIGGISNGTYLQGETISQGTDVGPGNCLIDLVAIKKLGEPFDMNGEEASRGQINKTLLDKLMNEKMSYPRADDKKTYYNLVPWLFKNIDEYKSSDYEDFLRIETSSLLRTFSEYTAEKIKEFYEFCDYPQEVIFHGGGTKNLFLMSLIRNKLGGEIRTTDDEIPSKSVEAAAFAYLAYLKKGEIFEAIL